MDTPPRPASWPFWLIAAVLLCLGLAGRALHSGEDYLHPDEVIAEGVLRRLGQDGGWDTNWAKADLPDVYRVNQYNFSSYFEGLHLYRLAATLIPGTKHFIERRDGVPFFRTFSVLCSAAAIILVIWFGCRLAGAVGGISAGALTAAAPILVQDAHYARPEAFVTLLFLIAMTVLAAGQRCTLQRAIISAFLLGVLLACKVSFAIVAWIPWVAWAAHDAFGRDDATSRQTAAALRKSGTKRLLVGSGAIAISCALGFALGVPGALAHPQAFVSGIQALYTQYAGLHPPHCHPSEAPTADLLLLYLGSTLGWLTLAAWLLGCCMLFRRKAWGLLLLLAAPTVLTLGYFGTRSVFFERNFSHVIPLVALVAAIGVAKAYDWCATMVRSPWLRFTIIGASLAILLAQPVHISMRLVYSALSGDDAKKLQAVESELFGRHPGVQIVDRTLFFDDSAAKLATELAVGKDGSKFPLILRHCSWGDDWTRDHMSRLLKEFDAVWLGGHPSLFQGIPVCTLHTYHSANYDYYLLRQIRTKEQEPHRAKRRPAG